MAHSSSVPDSVSNSVPNRIAARFQAIAAALEDLLPGAVGEVTRATTEQSRELVARFEGRVYHLFVLIAHLRDDAKRLAKRAQKPKDIVERFVSSHQAVVLCDRLAESHKHGLGGRAPNATELNGVVWLIRSPKGAPKSNDDPAIIAGMLLVDAKHGTFHSDAVQVEALRAWIDFLKRELAIDLADWEAQNLGPREKPVHLLPEHGRLVDPGSVVMVPIPQQLSTAAIEDVKRRSRAT